MEGENSAHVPGGPGRQIPNVQSAIRCLRKHLRSDRERRAHQRRYGVRTEPAVEWHMDLQGSLSLRQVRGCHTTVWLRCFRFRRESLWSSRRRRHKQSWRRLETYAASKWIVDGNGAAQLWQ